jgi:predicted ATPase
MIHTIAKCIFAHESAPILIEEPEVHLHPEKQALAADFLIETMNENHQLIVSTHSEHIIGRIQRRIAEGKIKSNDVSIIWIKHENESTGTTSERAVIDDKGIIKSGLGTYLRFFEDEMNETERARNEKR